MTINKISCALIFSLGLSFNAMSVAQESKKTIDAPDILFWSQSQKEKGFK